ncbi:MAG: hypothetical protein NVSMB14_01340 [Isosphaeraceae bacterium]
MKHLRHVGRFLALALIVGAMAGQALAAPPLGPEIDPGSMGSALTLLIGGVMALTNFRRKK